MRPELLAPAGDLEKLKVAVLYGADAVYLSGKSYGLRAGAGNFSLEEMALGIDFAHQHGAKAYVTVNIFAHNRDLLHLPEYLTEVRRCGADALIISDPGVFDLARRTVPDLPIHLSTQANTSNWAAVNFWLERGASRVILARELSLEEIREIHARCQVELEVFVHGAMCISYSGRCLLSNYMTGRDSNRGECAQPCRWRYALLEERRPGQFYPIEEDERGTYIFNAQDLALIEYLPDLIAAGVSSFKIEGRMKSVHYVGTVVKAYRQAIDAYLADPAAYRLRPEWWREISKVSHRPYINGFLFGRPQGNLSQQSYERPYEFVGLVLHYDTATKTATVEQRNPFRVHDLLEFSGPHTGPFTQRVDAIFNEEGQSVPSVPHPQQRVRIPVHRQVEPYTLVRRPAAL